MKSECAIALLVSHVSNLCFGAKNAQKSTYSFRAKASALFLQFLERLEQGILIFERFEQMWLKMMWFRLNRLTSDNAFNAVVFIISFVVIPVVKLITFSNSFSNSLILYFFLLNSIPLLNISNCIERFLMSLKL